MVDLVKRLRVSPGGHKIWPSELAPLRYEAAEEIVRLRGLNERAALFLQREAETLTKSPFQLHENSQRFRTMARELTSSQFAPPSEES